MGIRNAHLASMIATSPVCGVPLMRRGPIFSALHLPGPAGLAGTQTQGTRVCDDGPSAALAEERKTRKQSRCDEMHITGLEANQRLG